MTGILLLFLLAILVYFFYKWSTSTYDFFEKQGIPYRKPVPLFGTFASIFLRKTPFNEIIDEWFYEFENEK